MKKAEQLCQKIKSAVDSITVCLGQDSARVAIPKSDFRAGILGGDGGQPLPCCVQIVETLQFEVLSVRVGDQNFVNGV